MRPDYRAGCKRLVLSGNFYEAIQRPNVEVVVSGIERVEPDGRSHQGRSPARARRPGARDGIQGARLHAADGDRGPGRGDAGAGVGGAPGRLSVDDHPGLCRTSSCSTVRTGRSGTSRSSRWRSSRSATSCNWSTCWRRAKDREISPTADALAVFEAERAEAAKNTIWVTGCRSWYLDDRGMPAVWPWKFDRFRAEMAAPTSLLSTFGRELPASVRCAFDADRDERGRGDLLRGVRGPGVADARCSSTGSARSASTTPSSGASDSSSAAIRSSGSTTATPACRRSSRASTTRSATWRVTSRRARRDRGRASPRDGMLDGRDDRPAARHRPRRPSAVDDLGDVPYG